LLNVDLFIYTAGSILMACISIGFVLWGFKTGQFEENDHLKSQPLEEDGEDDA
jgi:cbb3-type cytochrome oxidase maturation protein